MTELELIEGCRRENNIARHELYNLYSRQMMGLCYRYTGSKATAEDLLHDGFLKIFRSIKTFEYRGEGSLQAWLSRVFTNTSIDYLQKNDLSKNAIPIENCYETEVLTEENDISGIPNDVLMQFIAELPVGYRTVFNLFAFEKKSHKEIGTMMNINESSSRSQLARAKSILMQKINAYNKRNE